MIECIFIEGALSERKIKKSEVLQEQTLGASVIFEGIVRADNIDNKRVIAIDFSAQKEIVKSITLNLLTVKQKKFSLLNAKIYHSIGMVHVGETCFRVEINTSHRKEAFEALPEIVDEFKVNAPVFGKEILEDKSYVWKENRKQ